MPEKASSPKKLNLIQLNFAVFLFGFTGLFGKWLTLNPLVIVFGRVAFATLALGAFLVLAKQSIQLKERKHLGIFLMLALFFIVHWGTFFASIQVSSVAICLISFSTAPIFTVLLEPLCFPGHRLKFEDVLVAGVVTLGVAIATPAWHVGNAVTQGILLGMVSGLAIAIVTLLNRGIVAHYPAVVVVFYQVAIMAVLLLPLMLIMRPAVTARDIGLLSILGVLLTAFTQLLVVQSMESVPARLAGLVITGMEVVYGIALAALLVPEIPSLRTMVGGVVIVGATLYATKRHGDEELLVEPV